MPKTRVSEKLCNIQDKHVRLLEEAISEIGRQGVMKWRIKKCLARNKSCEERECRYAPRGIGGAGKIDPFRG